MPPPTNAMSDHDSLFAREVVSHQDELRQLYVVQQKSLLEIQGIMRQKKFYASTRQLYVWLVEKWQWRGFPLTREPSQGNFLDCEDEIPHYDVEDESYYRPPQPPHYYPAPPQSPYLNGLGNINAKSSATQQSLPPLLPLLNIDADGQPLSEPEMNAVALPCESSKIFKDHSALQQTAPDEVELAHPKHDGAISVVTKGASSLDSGYGSAEVPDAAQLAEPDNEVSTHLEKAGAITMVTKGASSLDSGYGSAEVPDAAQPAVPNNDAPEQLDIDEAPEQLELDNANDDEDRCTIFSDASSLAPKIKGDYVSEFCEDVLRRLSINRSVCERLLDCPEKVRLPDLVKWLALGLCSEAAGAPTQQHRSAMYFIYKHHRAIVERLIFLIRQSIEDDRRASRAAKDNMSLRDKIDLWLSSQHIEGQAGPPNDQYDGPDADEIELVGVDLPDDHRMVFNSPAYELFILRLNLELYRAENPASTKSMTTVRARIQDQLPTGIISKNRNPLKHEMIFVLPWHGPEQESDDSSALASVGDLIAFTGTTRAAQATTVKDYLSSTWPHNGEGLVGVLRSGTCTAEDSDVKKVVLEDGTQLQATLGNGLLRVSVCGLAASIAEVGEQLGWIGAALQPAVPAKVMECSPFVRDMERAGTIKSSTICALEFRLREAEDAKDSCIPSGSVVVTGYPVPHQTVGHPALQLTAPAVCDMINSETSTIAEGSLIISTRPGTTLVRQMKDVFGQDPHKWRLSLDNDVQFHLCGPMSLMYLASAWSAVGDADQALGGRHGCNGVVPSRGSTQLAVHSWRSCPASSSTPMAPDLKDYSSTPRHATSELILNAPDRFLSARRLDLGTRVLGLNDFHQPGRCSSTMLEDGGDSVDWGSTDSETWSTSSGTDDEESTMSEVQHLCDVTTRCAPANQEHPSRNDIPPSSPSSGAAAPSYDAPQKASGKRRRASSSSTGGSGDYGDDDDDDDKPRRPRAKKPRQPSPDRTCLFACPFWKADRQKHRSCTQYTLRRVRDVKQHLRRKHCKQFYCQICFTTFADREEFHAHRGRAADHGCEMKSGRPDFLTHDEEIHLRKKLVKGSVEAQWFKMWDDLFSGSGWLRPETPYLDEEVSGDEIPTQDQEQDPDQGTSAVTNQTTNAVSSQPREISTQTVVEIWPNGSAWDGPPQLEYHYLEGSLEGTPPSSTVFSATNNSSGNASATTTHTRSSLQMNNTCVTYQTSAEHATGLAGSFGGTPCFSDGQYQPHYVPVPTDADFTSRSFVVQPQGSGDMLQCQPHYSTARMDANPVSHSAMTQSHASHDFQLNDTPALDLSQSFEAPELGDWFGPPQQPDLTQSRGKVSGGTDQGMMSLMMGSQSSTMGPALDPSLFALLDPRFPQL